MTGADLRLLYLSNAFPPGVTGRFPSLNPAGHATETRTAEALSKRARFSTVGLLPGEVFGHLEPRDESFGLDHELVLWDRQPELWHRWRSWRQLRRFYQRKLAGNERLDAVLVRNLTPVFNTFVRWLRGQQQRPLLVLILADSSTLGERVGWSRRLRYALKPMQMLDEQAIQWYDACISFGLGTRRYFEPRGVPWLWMPSAFNFRYDPPAPMAEQSGPIGFGYFGALAEHAAVMPMVQGFLDSGVPGTLRVCGYGKLAGKLQEMASRHPNFRFDGLLPNQRDCLDWAQQVDVLINPRLPIWGLDNSFPSKIFEFAMTGKAILSTRTGGVDRVLGDAALYIETDEFERALSRKLREVAALERAELGRRGAALRARVLEEYNWDRQAERMIEFLTPLARSVS
jgi:glycosyltransferase involved in cell wall biosynthesis